ncbi:CdiA family toxin C-terminal domain-containing protein [Xenorhabdus szentirmaii]|nr:CdiA family toxin C-terminal domain-containing protein [Xenorhabdus szentirmaii]
MQMIKDGATPDELSEALAKQVRGTHPEGQDPVKGLLIAWGNFFGVPLDVVMSNEQITPEKAAEIVSSGIPTSEAKVIQYVAAKAFLALTKHSGASNKTENPLPQWSTGEGKYSPKNQGTVTSVEHSTGKFDGKSLPNVDKGANSSTGQQVNAGNNGVKTPQNQTGETTNHLIPESFVADVTKHNTQLGIVNRKMGTISGAHKQDVFLESVEMTGGKINHKITDKRYPGLIEYKYQIPAINGRGQQIGFKKETVKTTYDPRVLPDTKMADMSNKAAKQAENYFRDNPNHRQYSAKVDGYWFQVTRDAKTGQVNNAFITMPARTSK